MKMQGCFFNFYFLTGYVMIGLSKLNGQDISYDTYDNEYGSDRFAAIRDQGLQKKPYKKHGFNQMQRRLNSNGAK